MPSNSSDEEKHNNNAEQDREERAESPESPNEKERAEERPHNPHHPAHKIPGAQPHPEEEDTTLINWATNDPHNPLNWSLGRKWMITGTACFVAFLVGLNSTAPTSAAIEIGERFHVSDETFPNSFWLVTAWNVAAGVVPMFVLPLMETFGIRLWYLVSPSLVRSYVGREVARGKYCEVNLTGQVGNIRPLHHLHSPAGCCHEL